METMYHKKSVNRSDYTILTGIEVNYFKIKYILQKANQYKYAEDYDRQMKSIGANANWFESQQKFEVKKMKKVNDGKIAKELLLTNNEIKVKRYMRLLELYNNEYDE